jgi:aprataxin
MQGDITVNLIDTKSGVSIPLKFGQNTVGRGFEGITDKRCSRNQVLLEVSNKPALKITQMGKNPSFIMRAASQEIESLEQGDTSLLKSGDILHVLVDLYPYRVQINSKNQGSNKNVTSSQPSSQLDKKRKYDEIEEKSDEAPPLKKQKIAVQPQQGHKPNTKADNKSSDDEIESSPKSKVNEAKPKGAFDVLMKSKGDKPVEQKSAEKKSPAPKAGGGWNSALIQYCTHPENFPDQIYFSNDKVVAMYDVYPKAKIHMLVMPRQLIPTFADLTKDSVPIVENVIKIGKGLVERFKKQHPTLTFKIGFHAVPSMKQIHMHLISQDFDSDCLKNKKHWNSFTTEFFIDADDFLKLLKQKGAISFDKEKYEQMLQRDLKCPKCGVKQPTIPAIKKHVVECNKKS